MPTYEPTRRQEIATWLYKHIQTLLEAASHFNDSSLVIYACFETRNFLEKLEFHIIAAALTEEERAKHFKDMEKMQGLNKAFGKLIQEKAYTYIKFMNALCTAKEVPFGLLGDFDFKISNRFKLELNSYCHLYSRSQAELEYHSQFIQNGAQLPYKVFAHLRERRVLDDIEGINIVGTPVSKLKGETLEILSKFRNNEIREQELVELLRTAKNY